MPSNHLILCCPFLLLCSIFASIRVFSNQSTLCMRWPKYWSFSFNISPSNEHPGLISFRMDWLDLLAVQGPQKSLLQHHSSKASILRHSALFMVQLTSVLHITSYNLDEFKRFQRPCAQLLKFPDVRLRGMVDQEGQKGRDPTNVFVNLLVFSSQTEPGPLQQGQQFKTGNEEKPFKRKEMNRGGTKCEIALQWEGNRTGSLVKGF